MKAIRKMWVVFVFVFCFGALNLVAAQGWNTPLLGVQEAHAGLKCGLGAWRCAGGVMLGCIENRFFHWASPCGGSCIHCS